MNEIKELEDKILKHKALYYQGRPEISDSEYDLLEDRLRKLDAKNPALNIVGTLPSGSNKVQHKTKMLSLGKTYKASELYSWANSEELISTFKIDGVSCSLIYKEGHLVLGKTRGDGKVGENITEKVRWLNSIPKKTVICTVSL